jgi:hypothetical protein
MEEFSLAWPMTFILAAAILIYSILKYLDISRPHSPLEPPVFASKVPYVGHIIGLLIHGLKYYQVTRYFQLRSVEVAIIDFVRVCAVQDASFQFTH